MLFCSILLQACRPWGAGGAMAHQLTLSQPEGQIMPPHDYWHPRIFRPSYGPFIYCYFSTYLVGILSEKQTADLGESKTNEA